MTDGSDWSAAQAIFLDALDQPTEGREAWIRAACGGDLALLGEVQAFLRAHGKDGLVGEWVGAVGRPALPDRVGAYRIIRPIGEGGMGAVYLAEREGEGFRQRVALKLLRGGWADPLLAERMARERAILARLEHPGIARLVDGGLSDDGRPFLAMEYVEGTGLLEHARSHALAVPDRVGLFIQVCDALQYAHQQLVVHRDLKPGNIMVGFDGRARLLDFGIATLIDPDQRPADAARTTAWLTPAYASPEQVRGERVSTVSDVYSLGVLLYELLARVRPYQVDDSSPAEVERVVCRTVPPRPSSRTDDPGLRRRLAGDLDTIVLTAMAKDPARRYQSAAALGDDLRRHLEGLTVSARPASLAYRTAKFAGRHATAVGAAALVLVSLLVGGLVAVGQARRATQERDMATREAERASWVSALLVDLFRSSDPMEARGDTVTARELLDRGTERINREFGDRPDIQSALLSEVAAIYANIGALDRAEALAERALALAREEESGQTLAGSAILARLGRIYAERGRRQEAIATLRQAVGLRAGLLAEPDSLQAEAEADLAWELRAAGEHDAAASLFRSALETRRRLGGETNPAVASLLLGLAATFHDGGRFAEADSLFGQVLARFDTAGARPHPLAATAMLNLGMLRRLREEYSPAEPLLRAAAVMRRRLFEPGHPDRLEAEAQWALGLIELGRFAEAEPVVSAALTISNVRLGAGHPRSNTLREELGYLLTLTGRAALAVPRLDSGLAAKRVRHGGDHPEVVATLLRSAEPLLQLGRLSAAAARFEEARAMADRTSGSESVYRMVALSGLGRVAMAEGDLTVAETRLREAAALGERLLRPGHRYVLALERERARLDLARGNQDAARRRLEAVLAGERATRPEGHPRVVETIGLLERVGGGR